MPIDTSNAAGERPECHSYRLSASDTDGMIDCCNCGIWFRKDDPDYLASIMKSTDTTRLPMTASQSRRIDRIAAICKQWIRDGSPSEAGAYGKVLGRLALDYLGRKA